jgi:hypothetical protein
MAAADAFREHERELVFAQLITGGSFDEKLRNLAWLKRILESDEGTWTQDELIIMAEEADPFLPADELIEAISSLGLLEYDDRTAVYWRKPSIPSMTDTSTGMLSEPAGLSLDELRAVLVRAAADRQRWTRESLSSVLVQVRDFGFACLRAWQAFQREGRLADGVPFLWNASDEGEVRPMMDLAASSATIDVIRLAIDTQADVPPTSDERELIEWALLEIEARITTQGEFSFYELPDDDSYPNAAHPINDSQSRIINLLSALLSNPAQPLKTASRERAMAHTSGLIRYLLEQQHTAPGEMHDGFWSFHRYGRSDVDPLQILTINSELAVNALARARGLMDTTTQDQISRAIARVAAALERTAVVDGEQVFWEQHFSTLASGRRSRVTPLAPAGAASFNPDVLATARAILMLATATHLDIIDDGTDLVRGGLKFITENWTAATTPDDDIEFVPYRSPQVDKWTDVTYRITNPMSAVLPYYILKACRLADQPVSPLLAEPVNNSLNFALQSYSGRGFWRDTSTEAAYPSNTAFNMEMLVEYLQTV